MYFHKDKAYFEKYIRGQRVMARTACIILRYTWKGEKHVLTIREGKKDILEFPGGKVEIGDRDIYDTCFREMWEEIILKDDFEGDAHHLRDWRKIRENIVRSNDLDERLCRELYDELRYSTIITYGNCPLKTIYFVVDVTADQAHYVIDKQKMIPVQVDLYNYIVSHNRSVCRYKQNKDMRFKRKNTHFCSNCTVFKLRGRDFEGMFRFASYL